MEFFFNPEHRTVIIVFPAAVLLCVKMFSNTLAMRGSCVCDSEKFILVNNPLLGYDW